MQTLYVFTIENMISHEKRNIAVLCRKQHRELSLLNRGEYTNFFHSKSLSQDKIIFKHTISILDHVYNDITRYITNNSLLEVFFNRGDYYLKVDNIIWRLSENEYFNNSNEIKEYKEVIRIY